MGNTVEGKCKVDSDCYKNSASPTTAESTKMCCAYMKITKLDTSKPSHASYIAALKTAGNPTTEGEEKMYCEDDYP